MLHITLLLFLCSHMHGESHSGLVSFCFACVLAPHSWNKCIATKGDDFGLLFLLMILSKEMDCEFSFDLILSKCSRTELDLNGKVSANTTNDADSVCHPPTNYLRFPSVSIVTLHNLLSKQMIKGLKQCWKLKIFTCGFLIQKKALCCPFHTE